MENYDVLRSLTQEEYDRLPPISKRDIQDAINKGMSDRIIAEKFVRPGPLPEERFYKK